MHTSFSWSVYALTESTNKSMRMKFDEDMDANADIIGEEYIGF